MRIGRVIGTLSLNRAHPNMTGTRYKIVVPQSLANLQGKPDAENEELIVYDDLGAGVGSMIAFSEGGEAGQPFRPDLKPVDAYCAAILDTITLEK